MVRCSQNSYKRYLVQNLKRIRAVDDLLHSVDHSEHEYGNYYLPHVAHWRNFDKKLVTYIQRRFLLFLHWIIDKLMSGHIHMYL